MNTCDSCQYWESIGENDSFGECRHPSITEGRPELNGMAEADSVGYLPCIYTGPQFGCVLHQAKC